MRHNSSMSLHGYSTINIEAERSHVSIWTIHNKHLIKNCKVYLKVRCALLKILVLCFSVWECSHYETFNFCSMAKCKHLIIVLSHGVVNQSNLKLWLLCDITWWLITKTLYWLVGYFSRHKVLSEILLFKTRHLHIGVARFGMGVICKFYCRHMTSKVSWIQVIMTLICPNLW